MSHWFQSLISISVLFAISSLTYAESKFVKIVHVDTGKVLAISEDSNESGAKTVLAKDESKEARQWKLEKDGDHVKILNRKSGKVLDVFEESTDEGREIIQWDDKSEGYDNQRWSWEGEGKERRLKSKSSGLVLDVNNEGKVIQRKLDDKAKGQLWRVVEVKE